jgi:hypothetical protein
MDNVTIRAAMDQFGALAADVAGPVAQYYRTLVAAGVPDEAAALLAEAFQTMVWERCWPEGRSC